MAENTNVNNSPVVVQDKIQSRMKEVHGFLFKKVPNNCILIKENRLTARIRYAETGFRLVIPFINKKTLLDMSAFSLDYDIKGRSTITSDDIDVVGSASVGLKFVPESLYERGNFYTQMNVEFEINKIAKRIINQVVATMKWEDLRQRKNVFIKNLIDQKGYLKDAKYKEMMDSVDEIYNKYGLDVTNVDLTKLHSPSLAQNAEEIVQKEKENKIRQMEAETAKKVAGKEAEAARLRAQGEAVAIITKGQAEADVIKSKGLAESFVMNEKGRAKADNVSLLLKTLEGKNFTPSDMIYYLTRLATSGNAVIVEGKTIDTSTMLLAVEQLKKQMNVNEMGAGQLENNVASDELEKGHGKK